MENSIKGLHHVTAIAGAAQRNYDFYTKVLGLRLVKKTVNFDDPGTYHLYYGNETGEPGTILTFFPWEGVQRGSTGTGMATEIGYAVPASSLDFWAERFRESKTPFLPVAERFGERYLRLEDPDGLVLNLVEAATDTRRPWITERVSTGMALKGFHNIVLMVRNVDDTAKVLVDLFGYSLRQQERAMYRFATEANGTANIIDVIEEPNGWPGTNAAGTNHHVAFRVKDEELLMAMREQIIEAGLSITEKIDRNYFYSLYFREPGGVLFEIATDNPGFVIDEDVEELGTHLMLPPQYEGNRRRIEQSLPALRL
jgi:glyoxalase family protein